jgi:hypothetical protein
MSDADPIVLSGGGVTVHKSYHEAAYPDPAIVILIEQFESDPQQVTVTESIPAGADATLSSLTPTRPPTGRRATTNLS